MQSAGRRAEKKVSNLQIGKNANLAPSAKNKDTKKTTATDRIKGVTGEIQHLNDVRRNKKCENGDPINMVTGSFMIEQCDLIINDILGDYAIERLYDSVSRQTTSPIGKGWGLSIFSHLDIYDNTILIHMPDTVVESFDKTDNGYISRRNGDESLLFSECKTGYHLFDAQTQESTYYRTDGQLDKVVDKYGNTRIYEYIGNSLDKIVFPSGQYLSLSFKGEHLIEIEDNLGRKIKYTYEGIFLKSVTIPGVSIIL